MAANIQVIAMWNGKMKALTFSYDDGIEQDKRLVEIFNNYGMKCTFNLNSGIMSSDGAFEIQGKPIRRLFPEELRGLYTGHEVAVHTLHHLDLTKLNADEVRMEIAEDKAALESLFGTDIYGMAYPYGTFSPDIERIAADCGIRYSRTTAAAYSFSRQEYLLKFSATCHHRDERLHEMLDSFLAYDGDEPAIFCVWGHSYEFYVNDNWELIEDLCKKAAFRDDIFYGTNSEVLLGVDNSVC